MRFTTVLGAAALGLALPTFAFAQPSSTTTSSAAPPSADAAAGAAVNTSATISAGMPVKDKAGKAIGKVTSVKGDAGGKQTATIAMGADTFAVDTSALAVDSGAATINATQDEIRAMMKKGGQK